MSEKNFEKFAYFISKASNFAIVIRPDKKKIVDGEVVFEPGLRMEFKNKMLSVEKTKDNGPILAKLREKLKAEENIDPKRRAFFEETAPRVMIPEEMVKEKLGEKNDRIAELEAENKILKASKKTETPVNNK